MRVIKNKLTSAKMQIFLIYVVQVVFFTVTLTIYKTINISGKWKNQTFTTTDFECTESYIKKNMIVAYKELQFASELINNIFVNNMSIYTPISTCTADTCFQFLKDNPQFDYQYQQIGAYQGAISNVSGASIFGNLGVLLWHFRYKRGNSIQSIQTVLQSSIQQYNLRFHIPIQQNSQLHNQPFANNFSHFGQNQSIILTKYFSFVNQNQTLKGNVSVKVDLKKIKQNLQDHQLSVIEVHSNIAPVINLSLFNQSDTQFLQIALDANTSFIFKIKQEKIVVKTQFIQNFSFLFLVQLICLFPIFNYINKFWMKQIRPLQSINNSLRQKLNHRFDNNKNKKHNIMSINQELGALCNRCQKIPDCSLVKQEVSKDTQLDNQFKFNFKLNQLSQKFKTKVQTDDHKYLLNNKFIIQINQCFEIQKKVIKSLELLLKPNDFFKLAYTVICSKALGDFNQMMIGILNKYQVEKQQKQIFLHFYYRFNSSTLDQLRTKLKKKSKNQGSGIQILDYKILYFQSLHVKQQYFHLKKPFFKIYYQKAFYGRVKYMLLSKYLSCIKEADKELYFLGDMGLQEEIKQIEQEIDNFRFQMSKK